MAAEVFIDTSGFYAQWDLNDPAHGRVKAWLLAHQGTFVAVTTEWVIGETCTLFGARRVPRLIGPFFDQLGASAACPSNHQSRHGSARSDEIISAQTRGSRLFFCRLSQFLRDDEQPNPGCAHD
jgi:hypothetical protein